MAHTSTLDTANNLVSVDECKHLLGYDTGLQQVVQIVCTNENAGGGLADTYFLISSTINDYYVWYDVDADPTDPEVTGRVGIEVDIENNDSATQVATDTTAAITAVTGMTATSNGNTVTVTNDTEGDVTAPTAGDTPFTVIEEVAGTSGDITEDGRITDLINDASWHLNGECDRELKSRSQTEYHDGNGGYLLYLNHPPISAVTLYQDSDRAWASTTEIASTDYVVYTEDNVGKIWLTGTAFLNDRRVIKVTYTGGFSTIPHDLEMACVQIVGHQLLDFQQKAWNKDSIANDGGTTTFRDSSHGDFVEHTIHKYKRFGNIV